MDDVYEVLDQARDDGERRRMLDRHPGLRTRRSVRQLLDRAEEARDPADQSHVIELALSLARALDPDDQAESLLGVAHLLFRRARYAEAESLYDEAAARAAERGLVAIATAARIRTVDCCGARGETARGLLKASELEATLSGRDADLGLLWTARGHLLLAASRYAESLVAYEAAARVHTRLGDRHRLAEVDLRRATALMRLGRFQESETLFRESKAWFSEDSAGGGPAHLLVAIAASNLGILAYYRGRYGEALSEYEEARIGFTRAGSEAQRAMVCDNIAETYLELNLLEESRALAGEAARIFSELGLAGHRARAELNLARGLLRERPPRRPEALGLLREARQTFLLQGDHVWTMLAGLDLAFALLLEAPEEANRLAEAAVEFCRNGRLEHYETYALWIQAEARLAAGRLEAADLDFETLLGRAERQNLSELATRCRLRRGGLAELRHDSKAARHEYDRAIDWIETTRAALGADDYRAAFLEDKEDAFIRSIDLALLEAESGGPAAEVLFRIERGKARILLDYVAAWNGGVDRATPAAAAGGGSAAAAALDDRRRGVREELNPLYRLVRQPDSDPAGRARLDAALDRIPALEAEIVELTRRIQSLSPARGIERLPSDLVERLSGSLDPDTALVDLFELDSDLVAVTLYRGSLAATRLPGAATTARELLGDFEDEVLGDMNGFDPAATGPSLVAAMARRADRVLIGLYHTILAPVEARFARAARLLIVPHRSLHFVPFPALLSPKGALIDRFEITLLPSAAAHVAGRRRRATGLPVLVGGPADNLPGVRDEIAAVAEKLGPVIVAPPSRDGLGALLAGARLIHFAGHATLRRDNPLFSHLALPEGRLTLGEVLELDLGADLVTLAGCDTAGGATRPGDELLGMARAFLHAGAQALVGALWPVDDRATRVLMDSFYDRLRRMSPAAALRDAQRGMRREWPHPCHWAGFVHVGSPNRAGGTPEERL
jgi:tetratricopeptide (TPR) repeat protein